MKLYFFRCLLASTVSLSSNDFLSTPADLMTSVTETYDTTRSTTNSLDISSQANPTTPYDKPDANNILSKCLYGDREFIYDCYDQMASDIRNNDYHAPLDTFHEDLFLYTPFDLIEDLHFYARSLPYSTFYEDFLKKINADNFANKIKLNDPTDIAFNDSIKDCRPFLIIRNTFIKELKVYVKEVFNKLYDKIRRIFPNYEFVFKEGKIVDLNTIFSYRLNHKLGDQAILIYYQFLLFIENYDKEISKMIAENTNVSSFLGCTLTNELYTFLSMKSKLVNCVHFNLLWPIVYQMYAISYKTNLKFEQAFEKEFESDALNITSNINPESNSSKQYNISIIKTRLKLLIKILSYQFDKNDKIIKLIASNDLKNTDTLQCSKPYKNMINNLTWDAICSNKNHKIEKENAVYRSFTDSDEHHLPSKKKFIFRKDCFDIEIYIRKSIKYLENNSLVEQNQILFADLKKVLQFLIYETRFTKDQSIYKIKNINKGINSDDAYSIMHYYCNLTKKDANLNGYKPINIC